MAQVSQINTHRDGRVPLSDKLLVVLNTYQPQKYLFEGQQGKQCSTSSARKPLSVALKKISIKRKTTLHILQHSYAPHLNNPGTNVQYLQKR